MVPPNGMAVIRRSGLTGILAIGWLLGAWSQGQTAMSSLKLSQDWEAALAPLRSMAVQDFGFIRSAYTYCENHLLAIAARRDLDRASAFDVILRLMMDTHLQHSTPIIKIYHPELAKIFGGGRITLDQYRDPANQEKMVSLLESDRQKWNRILGEVENRAVTLESLENDFAIVPRAHEWLSPAEAKRQSNVDALDQRILQDWESLKTAFGKNDAGAGGAAAKDLADSVRTAAEQRGVPLPNLSLDLFYHTHQPFAKAAWWYVFAALLYACAWLIGRPGLSWAGYALLVLGLIEQIVGIVARWILSGRAPLSNMFESFTFAIGGMVLVALIFEAFNRTRIVGIGCAVLGFIFMVLAHKAPIFDSQIRPLMPALQSSWLTYHVVTIMLSYSAFALSFFVSLTYLSKDLVFHGDVSGNPLLRRIPSLNALDVFTYRIIGIGFPLLTLGIIFGAVWAATAWGRPWGFDPKETWSAITWLIYAIYLHVRFLAGWKGRRAAVFSVLGFLGVLFTYLGVNYLLSGLHSYV